MAKAPIPSTSVNFKVPAHACDCHTHIFGDPKEFPFFAGRSYTPELATPADMAKLHKALHVERVVIVTPSVYGTDNSATIWGLKARGKTARGIAVIGDDTPDRDLDAMHKAGVRGIRLNLATAGVNDPAEGRRRFIRAAERMKARGWHIQMFTSLPVIRAIKNEVLNAPVPVVFDHFGGAKAALGVDQPGFSDLLDPRLSRVLLLGVGLRLLRIREIPVADLLPALVVAPLDLKEQRELDREEQHRELVRTQRLGVEGVDRNRRDEPRPLRRLRQPANGAVEAIGFDPVDHAGRLRRLAC